MPSIVDFSSAFPWLLAGFLAGLLVFWLARLLFGIDRRRISALTATEAALDDVRRYAADSAHKLQILETERSRIIADLEQSTIRAALVPQFERQLAELQHTGAARHNQLVAAERELAALRETSAADIAALRHDIDGQSGAAKYYESEFNRLFSDYDAAGKSARAISDELKRTKEGFEVASREARETVQLRSELASAKASLDAMSNDANELVRLRSELANAKADLGNTRTELEKRRTSDTSSSETLARVTAEYESKLKGAISEIAAKSADARKNAEEASRLKAELAARPQIADRSDELAALSAEKDRQQAELQRIRKSLEDSQALIAARDGEVRTLRAELAAAPAELENYRRFKDALDAANRIAAGLPEKT